MGNASPTLVLIPGWSMPISVFDPLCELLGDMQYECLPLPGYELPLSGPALWQDSSALVDGLVQHLPPGPVVLLGWSLGGVLALHMAERAQEKVKGIMLLASNPCFVQRDDWPGMASDTFAQFVENVKTAPEATLRRFLQLCCRGSHDVRGRTRWLREDCCFKGDSSVLLPGLNWLAEDHRPVLHQLTQPVLSVLAEQDALVPSNVSRCLPGESRVIPASSHLLMADQPLLVADQVQEFIDRIDMGNACSEPLVVKRRQ
ncbi:alpha/beta fold hydrolase [Aestuariirhabdus sp. Z084]|uniref:alpha/beta fold hydrolase n=1 Tax=Aestuariirhabdus haliotis TaxID=2918751 RepID=UPI00201B376F|nr:alpha/beta fold hydrolase [Aestuariirhabdus haliotis]MCL6414938.1 alpha/beta fold hydrolase [Aestuariirhabdus haliotis]MCL6418870.1 alpha/beta fold hydrolase [Aestuariirhabdus haliotis]